MNFKESAYHVLKEEGKPLSAKNLTRLAFQKHLVTSTGKTPERTMAAEIYKDLNRFGEKSLFIKLEKGLFGLREWGNDSNVKGIEPLIKIPTAQSIVDALRIKQYKSESPSEFEETIRDAFSFLGFEAELIGGSGDTDVLLTANIGQKSFKVSVDGKTSKSGKIIDRQIDWMSLSDHKQKNKADFVVIVGPSFSEGNLQLRANKRAVSLLLTDALINLIQSHASFPFTLTELRDLFGGKGDISTQLEDLISQNHSRRNILEKFKVVIKEMQSLQDRLGYFTFDSLAGREKIEDLEIEPREIEYIITLLRLPFINGVQEITEGKYLLAIRIKDIANIFQQISNLLVQTEEVESALSIPTLPEETEIIKPEYKYKGGSKYFNWYIRGQSVVAEARVEKPYIHHCPIEHFETILTVINEAFRNQNLVNVDLIFSMLEGKELSPNRVFKGKPEDYKIRMALGILEIEGILKWTGSKRPIEYKLASSNFEIGKWFRERILTETFQPTLKENKRFERKPIKATTSRQRGIIISIGNYKIEANSVGDLYHKSLVYLSEQGLLNQLNDHIPFSTSKERYLISKTPVHPNGKEFFKPIEYKGYYLESHKAYKNAVSNLKKFLSIIDVPIAIIKNKY